MDVVFEKINEGVRNSWVEGSNVLIFSNSRETWFVGTISRIFEDEDGEWLEVVYDETRLKQIQRYNPELQPTPEQQKNFYESSKSNSDKNDDFEAMIRREWTINSTIEIFDDRDKTWHVGTIINIINDIEDNEVLNVMYAGMGNIANRYEAVYCQFSRFSDKIKPTSIPSAITMNNDFIDISEIKLADLSANSIDFLSDPNDSSEDSSDSDTSGDSSDFSLYSNESSTTPTAATTTTTNINDSYYNNIFLSESHRFDKNKVQRRAPAFELVDESSTFSFPATNLLRNKKTTLQNIHEYYEL